MIELLIVIAVLGVLAVAVLSAINPIEQINRSYDTGSRSDAEQLISAVDRFYTAKQYYPWQGAADDETNLHQANAMLNMKNPGDAAPDGGGILNVTNILNNLSGQTGELKDAFISKIGTTEYNALYLHNHGLAGSSTYVCFKPKSKSFLDAAQKRCGAGMPTDMSSGANGIVCPLGEPENMMSCLP